MRRLAVLVAGVVLAGCGGASAPEQTSGFRGSVPPSGMRIPDFTLRDYRGGMVMAKSLRGKAVALTFLDTRCVDACPVIARQLAETRRLLGPSDRRGTAAYAVTVDPAADTPARVRRFLRRQGAEGAFGYLVGTEKELRPVWRAFEILSAVESGSPSVHSAPVRIYDRDGVWVSTLNPTVDLTPQNLAHDLRLAAAG